MMDSWRFLVLALLLFVSANTFAQRTASQPAPDTVGFALTPVKKPTLVRGFAFGLSADRYGDDALYMEVRGINLDVAPMGIVAALWGTVLYGLFGGQCFSRSNYWDPPEWHVKYPPRIRGVSFSVFGLIETHNSGFFVNGLASWTHRIKGVQISGIGNQAYESRGVTIAGLSNKATVAHGVQLGLINNCQSGNVVQIGLFNRIGNRVLPFVNMNFTSRKRALADSMKRTNERRPSGRDSGRTVP